jgi:tRNA-Thr(GGU) m(6)t(6)A37 methyltransferase TsaA
MGKGEVRFIGKVTNIEGEVSIIDLCEDFCEGLYRLKEYTHLDILYWFHLRDNKKHRDTILVIPKRHGETTERGVFASRSPSRPNPIGLSLVELIQVNGCTLTVRGLDALIDSPIVDIKPHRM